MKKILNIAIVALLTMTIVSCKDDLPAGEGIPQIYVTGSTTALPTDVEEYSVGDAGSANWSVSDAAVASVSGSGSTASVTFLSPGSVRVTATIGSESGYVDVTVGSVSAGVTVSYDSDGLLREDSTGTVKFTFDAPLAGAPKFGLDPKSEATLVDSLGDLAGSADVYTAYVRGGTGDGTPNALLRDVTVAENYGGDVADTISVALFTIDNTKALLQDIEFPEEDYVAWGSTVGFELTFSEAMRPMMTDAADTAIWAYFEYTQIQDGEEEDVLDSLVFTSEDMMTWSVSFTVPDSVEDGEQIYFGEDFMGDWLDLAGNEYDVAPVFGGGPPWVEVDMFGPEFEFSSVYKTSEGGFERTDGSDEYLTFMSYFDDDGIGTASYYYHIKEAYESDTTAAGVYNPGPKTLEEFTGDPIMAPDEDFDGPPYAMMTKLMSVDSAAYDIFWIAVDKLGNVSEEIDSLRFSFDKDGELTSGEGGLEP